jgi:hypothetical protein
MSSMSGTRKASKADDDRRLRLSSGDTVVFVPAFLNLLGDRQLSSLDGDRDRAIILLPE